MQLSRPLKILAGIIAVIAVFAMLTVPAEARNRSRSGSYTTGGGRSGTFSGAVSGNLRDGLTRSQSVTTGNGRVFNRSSTNAYDRSTGQFNRDVTGVNGNTRSFTGTAQDGQRSGTYSTGTGQSGSFNGSTQRNGDGSVTNSSSWTNQNGRTYNRSATTGYDKETNTVDRSVTGPGGNTRSGEITFTPDGQ